MLEEFETTTHNNFPQESWLTQQLYLVKENISNLLGFVPKINPNLIDVDQKVKSEIQKDKIKIKLLNWENNSRIELQTNFFHFLANTIWRKKEQTYDTLQRVLILKDQKLRDSLSKLLNWNRAITRENLKQILGTDILDIASQESLLDDLMEGNTEEKRKKQIVFFDDLATGFWIWQEDIVVTLDRFFWLWEKRLIKALKKLTYSISPIWNDILSVLLDKIFTKKDKLDGILNIEINNRDILKYYIANLPIPKQKLFLKLLYEKIFYSEKYNDIVNKPRWDIAQKLTDFISPVWVDKITIKRRLFDTLTEKRALSWHTLDLLINKLLENLDLINDIFELKSWEISNKDFIYRLEQWIEVDYDSILKYHISKLNKWEVILFLKLVVENISKNSNYQNISNTPNWWVPSTLSNFIELHNPEINRESIRKRLIKIMTLQKIPNDLLDLLVKSLLKDFDLFADFFDLKTWNILLLDIEREDLAKKQKVDYIKKLYQDHVRKK